MSTDHVPPKSITVKSVTANSLHLYTDQPDELCVRVGTLLFRKIFLLHLWRRSLGQLLLCNDELGGSLIADEIVQDWSGRLGDGFIVVVVEKTCSAGGGGGIDVVMVEGRVCWSFRGDGDFETMG